MTKPGPDKLPPHVCVLSEAECASLLGPRETWFRERAPEVDAPGFPKFDTLLD